VEAPHEQDLGLAAALPAAQEAGGEDTASVRDQKVAAAKELRKLGKGAVFEGPGGAFHDEQPRGVPLGERLLSDQRGRQLEVVGGGFVVGEGWPQNSFFWGLAAGAPSGTGRPRCS
jgi:hypothetical protein